MGLGCVPGGAPAESRARGRHEMPGRTLCKKSGKWYVRMQDGSMRSTGVPCGEGNAGRRAAQEAARRLASAGAPLADGVAAMADAMLERGEIAPATHKGYRLYARIAREYFGDSCAEGVDADSVAGFDAWMLSRGLSETTACKVHKLLSMWFSREVDARRLDWNPMRAVRAPRPSSPAPNPLTEESRARLVRELSGLKPSPEATAAWLALMAGLRRGECCGLMWPDVMEGGRVLLVARAVGLGTGGAHLKPPKSGRPRLVPVAPRLAEALDARRAACGGSEWVCGGEGGSWLGPETVSRWWRWHAREWELVGTRGRVPTFHDLRHTFATVAVRALDPKTAQDAMGHADINVTMSYADTELSQVVAASAALGEAFA